MNNNGELKLNMQDSTIKKKRGRSFFNADNIAKHDTLDNPAFIRGNCFNLEVDSAQYNLTIEADANQQRGLNNRFGGGLADLHNEDYGDEEEQPLSYKSSQRATMPKHLQKAQTQKEIVSAMVRLNT